MLLTVQNLTDSALEIGFPVNRTLAANGETGDSATVGISRDDMLAGADRGAPAFKQLNLLQQEGKITLSVDADGDSSDAVSRADAANSVAATGGVDAFVRGSQFLGAVQGVFTTPQGYPYHFGMGFLVAHTGAADQFEDHEDEVARVGASDFEFTTPVEGDVVLMLDDLTFKRFDGAAWADYGSANAVVSKITAPYLIVPPQELFPADTGDTAELDLSKYQDFVIRVQNDPTTIQFINPVAGLKGKIVVYYADEADLTIAGPSAWPPVEQISPMPTHGDSGTVRIYEYYVVAGTYSSEAGSRGQIFLYTPQDP